MMSTHAKIAVRLPDHTFKAIYVHFDGHFRSTGKMLLEFYNTYDKAKELVDMGDASSIDTTIETSRFYNRDYDEQLGFDSFNDFRDLRIGCQGFYYTYIFVKGQWYCIYNKKWIKLTAEEVA